MLPGGGNQIVPGSLPYPGGGVSVMVPAVPPPFSTEPPTAAVDPPLVVVTAPPENAVYTGGGGGAAILTTRSTGVRTKPLGASRRKGISPLAPWSRRRYVR